MDVPTLTCIPELRLRPADIFLEHVHYESCLGQIWVKYSRRQNKVSVLFALHGERSENGDITVEKTVSKTVVKRYLNGAKTVTRKTEAVKILRDRTCPRGSRSSMHVEDGGALGKC